MAQHRSTTLPVKRSLRSYALAALHADGAVVWQLPDGSHVESRDTWAPGTTGLSPTPADPALVGWTRLTPAP